MTKGNSARFDGISGSQVCSQSRRRTEDGLAARRGTATTSADKPASPVRAGLQGPICGVAALVKGDGPSRRTAPCSWALGGPAETSSNRAEFSKRSSFHRTNPPLAGCLVMAMYLAAGPSWAADTVPPLSPDERRPGGAATVTFDPTPSSTLPAANLDNEEVAHFHAGKALARQPWVIAPTATDARDGLGPLYNARTCLTCHVNGGRGVVPEGEKGTLPHGIVLLSVPSDNGLPVPEPTYGEQLQARGIGLADRFGSAQGGDAGKLVGEGRIAIRWESVPFTYPDGESVELRRPRMELQNLGYGPMHPDVMTSLRNAPALHGTGLLSLVDPADIAALADPDDRDGDGISGRVNRVIDPESGERVVGRFGWKADRASLREQVGVALQQDLGLSNPVFPEQPCSPAQLACRQAVDGADEDGLEVPERRFELLVDHYTRHIGVPERRKPDHPVVRRGRELFHQTGCADCHRPSFRTMEDERFPALSAQTIWPYSDLLIHDMGEALADGRPAFEAGPSEWRTAPLWGLGLSRAINGSRNLLHDGRARSVEEAILWHGGEAANARARYVHLTPEERDALEAFVRSL
ncbi:MAG: di-heme oxidoredictase family protein [Guyparkeria sp.]